ncbi:phytoene desaturase (plasmid) [Candidatus Profftella armatura (Diaphorina cf. continua)]|uniref:Phytoene dehydrogenase n=1 Tax=Candidatus Profftella armatura (Diaphorina cf. continua) TaxID=2661583 RepID=A0A7R6VZ56_9PROT|nr:phytoene desaturase [Candidatus Profftella armatura (Diaphorina cf. continua)]BCG49784.1 phytoene desaturase [Candidatus Profftella armatura (Diaphorina cf. continua)]
MKKAIIIGAGIGGIALAIRLQTAGISTIILEKRDKPGGRAYVYKQDGFTFDAGPTVITDPNSIKLLFDLSKNRMENYVDLLPIKPFYRLHWKTGKILNYENNIKDLEKQIAKFNLNDIKGYRLFLEYSKEAFKEGYLSFASKSFLTIKDMLFILPKLIKIQAWKSVYNIVSQFIENDYLKQAFSFNSLFIGGNPFSTSSIYTLIHALEYKWGVWFPRGGVGALINALIKLFQNLGGSIILNSEVISINAHENKANKVYSKNGQIFNADIIASNADLINTYRNLLSQYTFGKKKYINLIKKKMSNSLFIIYFGLSKQYPHLAHHTIFFPSNYKKSIENIFGKNFSTNNISIYLHSPSVTDLSLAPLGCSVFYALIPVPNLDNTSINWSEESVKFKNIVFKYLEKYYIPNLRKRLITQRIFTPNDFQNVLGSYLGSAFSFAPLLTQSAWFRPHNRDKNLTNLYFVGAGTHPGAGIPGVIASANITSEIILNDIIL